MLQDDQRQLCQTLVSPAVLQMIVEKHNLLDYLHLTVTYDLSRSCNVQTTVRTNVLTP